MTAVVEAESLTRRFGEVSAVTDLSFALEAGTITGFLGPNGAGKTTTLRMVLGLGPGADAPALKMRAVPKKPTLLDIMQKDRLRMTPAAKKVLEEASKPNRRRLYVTAQQVLAQILTLQPPDPAAVLLGALGVNTSEVRRRLDAVTPDS